MIPQLALVELGSLFLLIAGLVLLRAATVLEASGGLDLLGRMLIPAASFGVAFYYTDLYDLRIVRSIRDFCYRLPKTLFFTAVLLLLFYVSFPGYGPTDDPISSTFAVLAIGGVALVPLRASLQLAVEKHLTAERIVIAGRSPLVQLLIEEIENDRHFRYRIVCVAAEPESPEAAEAEDDWDSHVLPYPFLERLTRLGRIVEATRPDRIIVALDDPRVAVPMGELLSSRAQGIIVEDGVEAYERLTGKLPIESIPARFVVFSRDFRPSALHQGLQRAVSLVAGVFGLGAFALLLPFIALAIRLDSAGPIFFVQERIGRYGRAFRLYKLRTMHPSEESTSEWVRDNGDRVTRVGRWLRKARVDELPQFWNVLRGDMNLVGPRPHPASNYALFLETIPHYAIRAMIHPGITGWAQVRQGYANDLEEEVDKMRYDLFYVKHQSIWLDLRILFDTAKIVAFGRGA